MGASGNRVRLGPLVLALAMAGCVAAPPVRSPAPEPRPDLPAPQPSDESRALAAYYRGVENNLTARGLMRTDGGGPDVPFSKRQLVEDFIRIALYDEYVTNGAAMIPHATESQLRRWEIPVRMGLVFGDTIPEAQRREDRATIRRYARRLSRVTGHPISLGTPDNANFQILVLNEDERLAFAPALERLVPGIDRMAVRTIIRMPRSTFCLVFAFSKGDSASYSRAVAVIRGEHPDALRRSCIHEELAQGLGLANDSPTARPSIFNDDEEFALLTRHDEMLLRMLYDPRLEPGMRADEARPILRQIADELLGGDS